jgi:trimeric autotransporter adhesin
VFANLILIEEMKTKTIDFVRLKKQLSVLLTATVMLSAGVAANEVYIEQVGDNSTIAITQDGNGNKVGDTGVGNEAFIGGGSNAVTIDQIGSNNTLVMVVNGAAAGVIVDVTGSGNESTINCGTTQSAGCSSSTIKQVIAGDDNIVTQNLGTGANHYSEINITGDTNTVTHTSTNSGASTVNITATGDLNTIGVTQSGITAKTVSVNTSGNSNTVSITQSD